MLKVRLGSRHNHSLVIAPHLPSPDFPSPPTDVVTRTLQVYSRCPCPPIGPFVESSFMQSSSPAPVLQPYDDLPIAIWKGTHSTSNPYPVYNFLRFHRLSLPYSACVSTCLLSLPLTALVRLFLTWAGDRKWLRKWVLFTPMAHESLSLFLLASLLLVVVRSI